MRNKWELCKVCNNNINYSNTEVEIIDGKKFIKCPHCLNHIEIK